MVKTVNTCKIKILQLQEKKNERLSLKTEKDPETFTTKNLKLKGMNLQNCMIL